MSTEIKRVLVVDDDQTINDLIRDYVRHWQPEIVDRATTGPAAWQLLQVRDYDLVLLDWKLPGLSGMTLFNRIRALPRYQYRPVLVSSGLLGAADFRLLNEYPCTRWLSKPYAEPLFLEAVTKLLGDRVWYEQNQHRIDDSIKSLKDRQGAGLAPLLELLKEHKNSVPVTIMAARALRSESNPATSEALLRAALKRDPQSVPALYELGKLLLELKRYDEALDILAQAQKLSPKNLNRARLMGEVSLHQGTPQAAAESFAASLLIDPDDAKSKAGLDLSKAIAAHSASGSSPVDQTLAGMINLLAIAEVMQGRYSNGIKRYEEAIDFLFEPMDQARIAFNIGLAYRRWGKIPESIPWFRKADGWAKGTLPKVRRYLDVGPAAIQAAPPPIVEQPPASPVNQVPSDAVVEDELEFEVSVGEDVVAGPTIVAPAPMVESFQVTPPPTPPLTPPLATKGPVSEPVYDQRLIVPNRAFDPQRTCEILKRTTAARTLAEAATAKLPADAGRERVLLFHREHGGWQRALRQLELLGWKDCAGYSDIQSLLDDMQASRRPLILAWMGGGEDQAAFDLTEAVIEAAAFKRVGILIHGGGDKALIEFKSKASHLMVDRLCLVNWNRARFQEDILTVVASMDSPTAPLSSLAQGRQRRSKMTQLPSDEIEKEIESLNGALGNSQAACWAAILHLEWLTALQRYDDGLKLAPKYLQKWPEVFALRLAAAELAACVGSSKALVQLTDWLHSSQKSLPQRLGHVGRVMLRHRCMDELCTLLDAATGPFKKHYLSSFLTAKILQHEGAFEAAARCLEAAIDLAPWHSESLLTYGEVLMQLKSHKAAIEVAGFAMQVDSEHAFSARLLQAQCMVKDRQWKEAAALIAKVRADDPAHPEAARLEIQVSERRVG